MTISARSSTRLPAEVRSWWAVLGDAAAVVAFGTLAAALWAVNRRLPAPPGWDWASVVDWAERRPVSAAFRALSTAALMLTTYLVIGSVAGVVGALARAVGRPGAARAVEVVALPVVRRTIAGLLGLGLAVVAEGSAARAGAPPIAAASAPDAVAALDPAGLATMRALDPPPPTPPEPPEPPAWTIEPGDHLWALARRAFDDAGRDASDAELADYVLAIVERNRGVLVAPDQPDLVFPGQVFTRPPLP